MAVTIKDVARAAAVSIKTVSRVVNQEAHVAPETTRRVMEEVRRLGYAPNISARRLASQKSYAICLLMYPGYYQNSPGLLNVIMDIGYETRYDILLQPYFPTHLRSRNRLVKLLGEARIDGFITTPPCDHKGFVADLLSTYKVPLVQIDPVSAPDMPAVFGADREGARMITAHLLSLGHRRIACFNGPPNLRSSAERLAGFHQALREFPGNQLHPTVLDSGYNFHGGYTAARMALQSADPPSAIFAGHDEAAFGALFAAQELGVDVPNQLSIAGYGDLTAAAATWPGLTTVHQPDEEILAAAMQMLLGILQGKPPEQASLTIAPRLVLRGTTDPAA